MFRKIVVPGSVGFCLGSAAYISTSEHRSHCFRGFLACLLFSLPLDFSRPVPFQSLLCSHYVQSPTFSGAVAALSRVSSSSSSPYKAYFRALFGAPPAVPELLEERWEALDSLMRAPDGAWRGMGVVVAPSELLPRGCLARCEAQLRHLENHPDYHVAWLGEGAQDAKGMTMMEAIEAAAERAERLETEKAEKTEKPKKTEKAEKTETAPPPLARDDALALSLFFSGLRRLAAVAAASGRAVAVEGAVARDCPHLWAHLSRVFGERASLVPWGACRDLDVPLAADPKAENAGVVVFGDAKRAQPFVEMVHQARTDRQFREDAKYWLREMFH